MWERFKAFASAENSDASDIEKDPPRKEKAKEGASNGKKPEATQKDKTMSDSGKDQQQPAQRDGRWRFAI